MNEWKELKSDNLPPDILTGDYEFNWDYRSPFKFKDKGIERGAVFYSLLVGVNLDTGLEAEGKILYYRKPEPLPPTHEEIMTLWWCFAGRGWIKVLYYIEGKYYTANPVDGGFVGWEKDDFTCRKSADIPPEEG